MKREKTNIYEVLLSDGEIIRRFYIGRGHIVAAKCAVSAVALLTASSLVALTYQYGSNQRLEAGIDLRNRQIMAQQQVIGTLNADHQRLKLDVWTLGRMLGEAEGGSGETDAAPSPSGEGGSDAMRSRSADVDDVDRFDRLFRRYEELGQDVMMFERNLHGHEVHVNVTADRLAHLDRLRRVVSLLESLDLELGPGSQRSGDGIAPVLVSLREHERALAREEEEHRMLLFGENARVSCRLPQADQFREALESYILLSGHLAQAAETVGEISAEVMEATGTFNQKAGMAAAVSDAALRYADASNEYRERLREVLSVPTGTPIMDYLPTSPFGPRKDPFTGARREHRGIDYAAPSGSEVLAPSYGTVSFAGRKGGYGNVVDIDHGNGLVTRYAHLSRILSDEGDALEPGDVIGKVGSTGRSTGNHLHYEVILNGRQVDPLPFVEATDVRFECRKYLAQTSGGKDGDV